MAFDEKLGNLVRAGLDHSLNVVEKPMFGGLAFLVNGNMAVGVYGGELIVRLHADDAEAALKESGVRPFDMTGRPMKGWLFVGGDAIRQPKDLRKWLERGMYYAASLPKKNPREPGSTAASRRKRA
jgi:TfoX/Sxy family transcriptional regulator of competence genes